MKTRKLPQIPYRNGRKLLAITLPYYKLSLEHKQTHPTTLRMVNPIWWLPEQIPEHIKRKLKPHKFGPFIQTNTYRRFKSLNVWIDEWITKNGDGPFLTTELMKG